MLLKMKCAPMNSEYSSIPNGKSLAMHISSQVAGSFIVSKISNRVDVEHAIGVVYGCSIATIAIQV